MKPIFQYKCPNCGEYELKQKTFCALVSPDLEEKVNHAIKGDPKILKFIAEWEKECPRCSEKLSSLVKLKVVKERRN
jgi:DNA-directed RNA polymerase subunit RPC12/RpoP